MEEEKIISSIILPKNKHDKEYNYKIYDANNKPIFIIGANGSGKTSFSILIESNNMKCMRITAHKSLIFPRHIVIDSPEEELLDRAIWGKTIDNYNERNHKAYTNNKYLSGVNSIHYSKVDNKQKDALINDYEKLLAYLYIEHQNINIKIGSHAKKPENRGKILEDKILNKSILDRIIEIFKDIIPHIDLEYSTYVINCKNQKSKNEQLYNASSMSDGERAVFYYIAKIMIAENNSIIIVDEPENNLNKAIIVKLWNILEKERNDCKFIYLTHDINFVNTKRSQCDDIIWLKSYEGEEIFDYVSLNDMKSNIHSDDVIFDDELLLQILGNKQKILFVESVNNSEKVKDIELYRALFKEFRVIAVGSCRDVIQNTKAMRNLKDHHLEVFGLIDRDRRTKEQLLELKEAGVSVLDVAEFENLFLLLDIIKENLNRKNPKKEQNKDNIAKIKKEIIEYLNTIDDDKFKIGMMPDKFELQLDKNLKKSFLDEDNKKLLEEVQEMVNNIESDFSEIKELLKNDDDDSYNEIIKRLKNKKLIYQCKNFLQAVGCYDIKQYYTEIIDNIQIHKESLANYIGSPLKEYIK